MQGISLRALNPILHCAKFMPIRDTESAIAEHVRCFLKTFVMCPLCNVL